MQQAPLLYKSIYFSRIFGLWQSKPIYLSDSLLDILYSFISTEERIFLDEKPIFFVSFGYHTGDGFSESLSIDKPQKGGF